MRARFGFRVEKVSELVMLALWVRLGLICCGLAVVMPAIARAEFQRLDGQVSYKARIALPEDAILEVQLLDVSRADAPAFELAAIAVRPVGQVPIEFSLMYDDALVDERHSYSVRAVIRSGQKAVFQSTSHVVALTRGAGRQVAVVMEQVADKRAEPALAGTTWTVVSIQTVAVSSAKPPTLAFSHTESLNGFSGCNNYTAPVVFSGDGLQLGPIAATKMACAAVMSDLEHSYFAALERAVGYHVNDGLMILRDQNGRAVLTFH